MHFSHALIALVAAGTASAFNPSAFPSCSLACLSQGLTNDGCSNLMDFSCQCQQTGLVSVLNPCFQKSCSPQDQAIISQGIEAVCSSVGYPVSWPAVATSTPAAPTSTMTWSCPGMSSGSSAMTSSVAPASSSAPMTSTPMATSTPMTPSTAASSTPNPSPTFNAAANIKGGLAGVAAAAAAVAYML